MQAADGAMQRTAACTSSDNRLSVLVDRRASLLHHALSGGAKIARAVSIVPVNSYSLSAPKHIQLSELPACVHQVGRWQFPRAAWWQAADASGLQSSNKPNAKFATSIGNTSVLTRSVESLKPPFPSGQVSAPSSPHVISRTAKGSDGSTSRLWSSRIVRWRNASEQLQNWSL